MAKQHKDDWSADNGNVVGEGQQRLWFASDLVSDQKTAAASSPHTLGHVDCPACQRMRMHHTELLSPDLIFPRAFEVWIETLTLYKPGSFTDARYIGSKTQREYRQFARALSKMFDRLKLCNIHLGHIREYHRARAFCDGAWKAKAGAKLINKEVGMLIRILRSAGCWNDEAMKHLYQPLAHVESDVQRALNPDEQDRFLAVAGSRERWHYIRNYSVAALQTTASTNEMRNLRIADVRLDLSIVQIRTKGAKNRYRVRSIPIETVECKWAFEALMYRAQSLGASAPHHFLFPIMESDHRTYDPTRPMGDTGIRDRWNEVREAAGLPWLRTYDLRHTGISRMAESGVPITVIMSFAGHMSAKMQQHYTSISMMSQRKAVASTWSAAAPPYMMGITAHNNGFNLYKKTS